MTTLAIRKKLADYIQVADDKKVKAVYALLETDLNDFNVVTMEQYHKELELADKEIAKGKFVGHKDVEKRFQARKTIKKRVFKYDGTRQPKSNLLKLSNTLKNTLYKMLKK